MKYIFYKDNKKKFNKTWKVYLKNNKGSYNYLLNWLEYQRSYAGNLHEELSFTAVLNNKPAAICFLPVEKANKILSISLAGGYTPAPLAVNYRIEKIVFKKIEDISKTKKIKKIMFFYDPLISVYQEKTNILRKYGYLDSSSVSGILDLHKKSQKQLWLDLRRGTKYCIKQIKAKKEIKVCQFDCKNPDYRIHEKYRKLHFKCAGKKTRAKKTFDLQFKMLKQDSASLFALKHKNKFIGFSYFLHCQKTAIYASAADDPDFKKMPISHILLWSAILYYQKRKFDFINFPPPYGYFEIGGFGDYQDQKQVNIALFKRSFGTKMLPLFRGIKYFNKQLFLADLRIFKKQVLKSI